MAFPEIFLGSKFDAKGFKQAETALGKLNKSVKNLAGTFGLALSGAALVSYSKKAIKAFADDEKAARSLSLALANTGNAFAAIGVEKFIGDLQRATGVLDDNLRPAFRTLLTATGDVKKSQDGLALALDIAAGTGKDLGAVSSALAKAYGGQTTALSRLGAGLSKATLESGDLDLITSELTKKFSGQALAAAEGYAGQMAKLTVASENAKEIIGKDLLDAMARISGKDGIGGATTAMEGFATEVGNVITGISVLIAKLKSLPGAGFIKQFIEVGTKTSAIGYLSRLGASSKAASAGTPAQSPGERAAIDKANKDAIKLQKTKNTLSKIDNDNTSRKLVLTGDQLALQELEKKFDVERIGLYAALNQSTDSETKMRLLSLIAIQEQNTALAGQIQAANQSTNALDAFKSAILDAIKALVAMANAELNKLNAQFGVNKTSVGLATQTGTPSSYVGGTYLGPDTYQSALGDIGLSNKLNKMDKEMVVNIYASGIGDQQIASVVQGAIQDLNRYGSSTTYAGAI